MVKSRFEAALVLQAHGDELKCKNRKLERHSRVQKQEKYFHGPGVQQKLNVECSWSSWQIFRDSSRQEPPGVEFLCRKGNIIVPYEEGDWCGSLPKLGWKSTIVSATTKETKKSKPS